MMDINTMKEYLSNIYQLEKYKRSLELSIEKFDQKISHLVLEEQEVKQPKYYEKSSILPGIILAIPIAFISAIILAFGTGAITYILYVIFFPVEIINFFVRSSLIEKMMDTIINFFEGISHFFFNTGNSKIFIIIVIILVIVINTIYVINRNLNIPSLNQKMTKKYNDDVTKEHQRAKNEMVLYKNLNLNKKGVLDKIRELDYSLEQLYSLEWLPAKYRTLVAVANLYEYLETGRCVTIMGHGGIYDTYEYDMKMNMILFKMDEILVKLDEIAETQRLIYNAIQENNQHLERIEYCLNNMEEIDQQILNNTEVSAYYSACDYELNCAKTFYDIYCK